MGKRGERMVIDPSDRAWIADIGLTSVSRLMKYEPDRVAAVSESSETFPVATGHVDGAPDVVFVKRYRYRGWRARLGGMFRGTLLGHSRARFEYEFLTEMRRRGVAAVRPIAYGEKRRRGFLAACCLLTEGETDVVSLDVWLSREWPRAEVSRVLRRSLTVALGRLIRTMHQAGVRHGGLFGRNILLRREGETVEFVLLDPDRSGRLHDGPVPPSGVASDLSDLAASAAGLVRSVDVIRFLRSYLDVARVDGQTRRLVAGLVPAVTRKTRQERHRKAIGGAMDWVQRRVERGTASGRRGVTSIEAFLTALEGATVADRTEEGRVSFTFRAGDGQEDRAVVVLNSDGVTIERGGAGPADLRVTADGEAWLAIVNGEASAFDLIRRRRVTLDGRTELLPTLARLLDSRS